MIAGYNTNGFAHHRVEDAIVILAELGYQSIALTLDIHTLNPFSPDLDAQVATLAELLSRHQLRCVVETGARFLLDPWHKHQPTLLDPDPHLRSTRLDFLRRAVNIAALLGADAVSFWSGTAPDPAPVTELWERLIDSCLRLCDYADAQQVNLAFEPEPGMFVDTMSQFEELITRVNHPRMGLTLDVGHLICLDEVPTSTHMKRWANRLWNVHLEDMRPGVHDHLLFGEGVVDFVEVFSGLREANYEGGIHVELSRHSYDAVNTARRSMEFLSPLLVTEWHNQTS